MERGPPQMRTREMSESGAETGEEKWLAVVFPEKCQYDVYLANVLYT